MKPPAFVREVNGLWLLDRDQWITPAIIKAGRLNWDDTFNACLRAIKGRKGTMIDVGAFIGDSAAWFNAGYSLLTFEPQRDAFVCLSHNLPNGTHYPFPAGDGELVGLQFGEGGNMGARVVIPKGEQVRTLRIDDLQPENVALIKIDAEGWEPKVLAGAKDTIATHKPAVVVECNRPALARWGFTVEHITSFFAGWRQEVIFRYGNDQWDTLFTPL